MDTGARNARRCGGAVPIESFEEPLHSASGRGDYCFGGVEVLEAPSLACNSLSICWA